MQKYDAIIIGTGQAGPPLAARLVDAGMKVAVIERKSFGGTCVNTGCIPTKTLIASAYAAKSDPVSLQSFFQDLPTPIDHVMVTAGAPHYGPPLEMPPEEARRGLTEHLLLALEVARGAADKVRPPGSLVFMGGTGARRPRAGLGIASTATVAFPTLIANLALELAPIRVNLIAAGFVDTPLSASILGDDLDKRRDELRATLPIRRVVGPADVAALAVHIMSNTALTGATYDIDGGQQLVS